MKRLLLILKVVMMCGIANAQVVRDATIKPADAPVYNPFQLPNYYQNNSMYSNNSMQNNAPPKPNAGPYTGNGNYTDPIKNNPGAPVNATNGTTPTNVVR